ncbi:MAG: hypothetical protein ACRETY_15515 [Steroidobacteraceae bacterium]
MRYRQTGRQAGVLTTAELRIRHASLDGHKARLATPDGKETLNDLARLIAETAFEAMPPDLQESLAIEEGMAAFREAWPDIVDAFLFRRTNNPSGPAGVRKGAKRTAKRRRIQAK